MRARPSPRRPLVSWVVDGDSMPVPNDARHAVIRERDFLLGRVQSWSDSTVASISGAPVTLQSTHEAALDVVDLADHKRRELELS